MSQRKHVLASHLVFKLFIWKKKVNISLWIHRLHLEFGADMALISHSNHHVKQKSKRNSETTHKHRGP